MDVLAQRLDGEEEPEEPPPSVITAPAAKNTRKCKQTAATATCFRGHWG
jgi:hypothetical protein